MALTELQRSILRMLAPTRRQCVSRVVESRRHLHRQVACSGGPARRDWWRPPLKLAWLTAAVLVVGCASHHGVIPIEVGFSDLPVVGRIELRYTNDHDVAVCLPPESWPNAGGRVNQASGHLTLVVEGRRFPVEDFNTGFCPDHERCAIRVAPGEEVTAWIPYAHFRLPAGLAEAPKFLEFSAVAFICQ